MESENTITAPQIFDTTSLYGIWRKRYRGSVDDFYRFMTAPSVGRDQFVTIVGETITFNGTVASTMII